jgi:hypothetical protein
VKRFLEPKRSKTCAPSMGRLYCERCATTTTYSGIETPLRSPPAADVDARIRHSANKNFI